MSRSVFSVPLAAVVALVSLILVIHAVPAVDPPKSESKPLAFTNATIYTATDDPIPNGVLVIRAGKIVAVGPANKVKIPEDAEKHDLKEAIIIPGLVDTHSHIGIYPRPSVAAHSDGNEMTGPVQPGLRALDGVWPDDPGIRMATAGGVTTANIMPGSGNVIGGQTIYVKLRGKTIEEMRLTGKLPDGMEVLGGLKMANGENPKGYGRNKQQAPFTRMKVAALQREQFVKAREYKAKKDSGQKVEPDVSLEPLVEVLERKRTVHFHCHRADDLLTAVRIAEEFGFELVLQHATEGFRVADILAKKKIPASLTLIDSPGGKAETVGLLEETAAILDKAGVLVAINTDDSVTESRFLLRTGAIALCGGMSEAAALRALTIAPAKMMHLDHRLGSLEAGKDADFAVLSGPPFHIYTQVLETYIDGKKVFDRSVKRDWAYQAGGFALPDLNELPRPFKPLARPMMPLSPKPAATTPDLRTAKVIAIRAGRIHTAVGPPISQGVILIENGAITKVGPAELVQVPDGAVTLTAVEVTPGLIDPFCVSGLSGAWNIPADQDQDELSDPNAADLRVIDGFNPNEPLLEFLRSNGVTVVHTTPGRANVIAGQSAVFRTDGRTAEQALKSPAAIVVNLGESPKEANKAKGPATRMAVAKLVRDAFTQARSGIRSQESGDKNKEKKQKDESSELTPDSRPLTPGAAPRSPKLLALIPALEGKIPVYFAANRADDIATALRIAAEFKLKPIIALGTESYRMADALKKAGVSVVVHPTMQRAAGHMETLHGFVGNAAVLADAGVPIAICTGFEGYVPKTRVLRHEAAMAAANGLGPDRALKAVTIDAAKLLGIADRQGTLEPGKIADVVLYDGDPFDHATHVTHTLMNGKVVYERAEYLKLPFERRILPLLGSGSGAGCCMGEW